MRNKGFNLIELMVGLTVLSVAVLMGSNLYLAQEKEKRKIEAANTAFTYMRAFFDQRSKFNRAATDHVMSPFGDLRFIDPRTYERCTTRGQFCVESYRYLDVQARSTTCTSGQKEQITVECVDRHPNIPDIDLNLIKGPAVSVFNQCAPGLCNPVSGILSQAKIPRIKVTRTQNCGASPPTVTYFPLSESNRSSDGSNGNPVAAVVCMTIPNGTVPTPGPPAGGCEPLPTVGAMTPAASGKPYCIDCNNNWLLYPASQRQARLDACRVDFRDYNLSVFMITRTGPNEFDMIQQVANFPKAKLVDPDAPQVLGVVADPR